jgi:ABC-type histidine transport system ATPase subunit
MQLPAVHPILEAREAAGGAAEAPAPRPAVVAVDLVKTYGSGEAADITRLKDKQLTRLRRSAIGFVFQSFNLLPTLTAAENIELPLRIDGRRLDRDWLAGIVRTLGLGDRLRHRPSELSGGQQQRGELEEPTVGAVLDRLGGLEAGR